MLGQSQRSRVQNCLTVMHNTLLTSLAGLSMDPFATSSANWVTRRRASRMCAQVLSHQSWAGLHALSYFIYWGHAARLCTYMYSPISVVLRIRNTQWLRSNWKQTRRQLGFWPNSYRFIHLAWEEFRGLGSPPDWEVGALDKLNWRLFTNKWLVAKRLQPLVYYDDLDKVDLMGRSLLQVGEKFVLLPFRHVPIEPEYESSFRMIPSAEENSTEVTLQF